MKFLMLRFGIMILCFYGTAMARVVGSNTTSGRQVAAFFPATETNNQMLGFSVFEKGIMLENSATTCLCDAFFPLFGDIVINGGTLTLTRDLELKSPYTMGVGKIDGQSLCSLSYPGNVSGISIPTSRSEKLLRLFADIDAGSSVNSVDWSFDDKYVAIARQGTAGNELQIYYVNDFVVTLTAGLDFGTVQTYCVRWHPSAYYLALGKASGTDTLETYYFNVANGSLQKRGGLTTSAVNAVAWSPSGAHLAVGRLMNTSILVYDVANGVLGTPYITTYSASGSGTRTVQQNALDWDPTGSYLATGLDVTANDAEVKIFYFNGSSIARCADGETGKTAYAVSWHPSGLYLAVGMASTTESLKIYSFNPVTKELAYATTQLGFGNRFYGLRWNTDGAHIAAVTATSSLAYDLTLFSFDSQSLKVNTAAGYRFGSTMYATAWSHDGTRLCTGDSTNKLKIFTYSLAPLIFKDINLFFNSDVAIVAPLIFQGSCLINGGGRAITFGDQGSITVTAGSSLLIENANIKGITANCVGCASDTSTLILRNVIWDQDSVYTFSVGSLQLKDDILMSGLTSFVYSSSRACTFLTRSELTLDQGFTLSYDPQVIASKELFVFEDSTASLVLDGATLHVTTTGLALKKGTLHVKGESFLEVESVVDGGTVLIDEGICFGDGDAAHDMGCKIFAGSSLHINNGSFIYKNYLPDLFSMLHGGSRLFFHAGSRLSVQETLNLGVGALYLSNQAKVDIKSGKELLGSVFTSE